MYADCLLNPSAALLCLPESIQSHFHAECLMRQDRSPCQLFVFLLFNSSFLYHRAYSNRPQENTSSFFFVLQITQYNLHSTGNKGSEQECWRKLAAGWRRVSEGMFTDFTQQVSWCQETRAFQGRMIVFFPITFLVLNFHLELNTTMFHLHVSFYLLEEPSQVMEEKHLSMTSCSFYHKPASFWENHSTDFGCCEAVQLSEQIFFFLQKAILVNKNAYQDSVILASSLGKCFTQWDRKEEKRRLIIHAKQNVKMPI